MSDIIFEASKTVSIGGKSITYTVRRVFTSDQYNSMLGNYETQDDVDNLHYFINNDMEMQLKRMTNDEENT